MSHTAPSGGKIVHKCHLVAISHTVAADYQCWGSSQKQRHCVLTMWKPVNEAVMLRCTLLCGWQIQHGLILPCLILHELVMFCRTKETDPYVKICTTRTINYNVYVSVCA